MRGDAQGHRKEAGLHAGYTDNGLAIGGGYMLQAAKTNVHRELRSRWTFWPGRNDRGMMGVALSA
jgi:hypothetical protein